MTDITETTGSATGGIRTLLRLEGLALLAGATWLYASDWGGSWWLYVILFFAPDLSFLAYLAGPKIGAWAYNAVHSTLLPLALLIVALAHLPHLLSVALIWLSHIGFDRALGYGLKYEAGFGFTHLGRLGKT